MNKTLAQIRNDCRILIGQTDSNNSNFTDAELNGYINQAAKYLATVSDYPRDHAYIACQTGYQSYNMPTDAIKVLDVYFGDPAVKDDCLPLGITTEQKLKEYYPGWLNNNSETYGRPQWFFLLDRLTLAVYPTPSATYDGKKIILNYVYNPAELTTDADTPDLPPILQDNIKLYVGYLCYLGKLTNQAMAESLLKQINVNLKVLTPDITDDTAEKYFDWANFDDLSEGPRANNIGNHRIT